MKKEGVALEAASQQLELHVASINARGSFLTKRRTNTPHPCSSFT